MSPTRVGSSLVLLLFLAASTPGTAAAPLERNDPYELELVRSGRQELVTAWHQANEMVRQAMAASDEEPERAKQLFLDSAALFDGVAQATHGSGEPYWRSSRSHWLLAENLPLEAKQERIEQFTIADERAAKGLEVDPACAPCMLWRFTSMGRLRTTQSVISGLRGASVMADLLERGIALQPKHRDSANNSTLGNLHYGSAVFYRVLPDWTWLGWVLGVRGDKERALEHARRALELHPARLDFRLEVGSQLMCIGSTRERPERVHEGAALLAALLEEPTHDLREKRQLAAAEIMLHSPEKACGYTGDTWVEIDAREAADVAGDF